MRPGKGTPALGGLSCLDYRRQKRLCLAFSHIPNKRRNFYSISSVRTERCACIQVRSSSLIQRLAQDQVCGWVRFSITRNNAFAYFGIEVRETREIGPLRLDDKHHLCTHEELSSIAWSTESPENTAQCAKISHGVDSRASASGRGLSFIIHHKKIEGAICSASAREQTNITEGKIKSWGSSKPLRRGRIKPNTTCQWPEGGSMEGNSCIAETACALRHPIIDWSGFHCPRLAR